MGLPIGKILKGVVGLVIGKSAKKAGMDEGTSKSFVDIADDLIDNDQEIADAVQEFVVNFEGKYSELQSGFERITRTIVRPLITLVSVAVLFYMGLKQLEIPWVVAWIGMIAVGGWFGARPFEKAGKVKKWFKQ